MFAALLQWSPHKTHYKGIDRLSNVTPNEVSIYKKLIKHSKKKQIDFTSYLVTICFLLLMSHLKNYGQCLLLNIHWLLRCIWGKKYWKRCISFFCFFRAVLVLRSWGIHGPQDLRLSILCFDISTYSLPLVLLRFHSRGSH